MHDSVLERPTHDRMVSKPSAKRVDRVVTYWRCDLLLAYKSCQKRRHSHIYVGDIAKDLAMRKQEVGTPQELVSGHESATF